MVSKVLSGKCMVNKNIKKMSTERRKMNLALGVVLFLAILLRIVYFLQYKANAPYFSQVIVDSYYYDVWAQRVASGKGFGPMPFYMAPLYPYVLALVYRVFGHNLALVYVFQMILGVLNTFMVYLIARKLVGHTSGIFAVIFMLFYGPLIYLEPKIMTETLSVALNLGSILLLLIALERQSVPKFLVCGILLGLSAVCRANALLTAVIFIGWVFLSQRETGSLAKSVLPMVLGVVLAILPVTMRNYFVGNDFVLISSNGGIVFAQGNNEYANGVSAPLPGFSGSIGAQREEEMALAAKALGHPVKQSESAAYWFGQGIKFIRDHPGEFVWLLVRKVVWSLHNRESRCSYNFYLEQEIIPILRFLVLPFPLLAGLALFGFLRGLLKGMPRETNLVALYVVSIFLSLVIFSVSSRYRAPAVPALAIFAGFGVVQALKAARERDIGVLVRLVGCVVPILALSLVPYPIPAVTPEGPGNLGVSYLAVGKLDEAISQFERALDMKPDYTYVRNNLGIALARQGKLDEAIEEFRQVLAVNPRDVMAHKNLGMALKQQGNEDEAIMEFYEAVRIAPNFAIAHVLLADSLAQKGKFDEAIEHYSAAVALEPEDPKIRLSLGNVLYQAGRAKDAICEYLEVIRLKPDLAEAHNNLAVAYFRSGDYAKAWREVILARKYGMEPNSDFIQALSQKMPKPESE